MCQVILCCLVSFCAVWYHSGMGKYNGFTDARKRANNKYLDKLENIAIYVPKGKRQIIKDGASERGLSVNKFIIQTLEEKLHVSLHDESW